MPTLLSLSCLFLQDDGGNNNNDLSSSWLTWHAYKVVKGNHRDGAELCCGIYDGLCSSYYVVLCRQLILDLLHEFSKKFFKNRKDVRPIWSLAKNSIKNWGWLQTEISWFISLFLGPCQLWWNWSRWKWSRRHKIPHACSSSGCSCWLTGFAEWLIVRWSLLRYEWCIRWWLL
jgi:hypothetical protein